MKKIIVTHSFGFTEEQKNRLKKLGKVIFHTDKPKSEEEWLNRITDADIIISEKFGLKENIYNLKNVFVSYPFVSFGDVDMQKLKENNVILANSPGCNKDAVVEWIIFMMLELFRKFSVKTSVQKGQLPPITQSLKNKTVTILGRGNIGKRASDICKVFGMNVKFFTRNDDLIEQCKNADVIVNCLSLNKSTKNLLDKNFFFSLKKNSYFINCSRKEIIDIDAMIDALDQNILIGVADDCSSEITGDTQNEYYKKLSSHKKAIATPHIAWNSNISIFNGNETVIENIENWVNENPKNIVK